MKSFKTFLTEAVNPLKKALELFIFNKLNNTNHHKTIGQQEFFDLFYECIFDFIKEYLSDHDFEEVSKEEIEQVVNGNLTKKIPSYIKDSYRELYYLDKMKHEKLYAIPFLLYDHYVFYRYENYIIISKAFQDAHWYNKQLEENQLPNLFETLSQFGFDYTLIDDHNWIYEIEVPDLWTINFSNWLFSISSLFTKNPFTKITLDSSLYYNNRNLKKLPWCPNVTGDFDCSDNPDLISLVGCPESVGSNFSCSGNNLTSLKGCPKLTGNCYLTHNKFINLKGSPNRVFNSFYCDFCSNLVSLDGAPKIVNQSFYCRNNPALKSLKGLEKSSISDHVYYDTKNMIDLEEAKAIVKKVTGKK